MNMHAVLPLHTANQGMQENEKTVFRPGISEPLCMCGCFLFSCVVHYTLIT
jgi:hypothetical protein